MRNMGNSVGNVDDLRKEREARKNPPEYDIGQDDDSWDFFDNDSQAMDNSSFGGVNDSGLGDSFGMGGMQNTVQNSPTTSSEDKFFDALVGFGKFIYSKSKELYTGISEGFKNADAFFWSVYGKKVMYTGLWVSAGGAVLGTFGLFTGLENGFWVMMGGLITTSVGLLIFSLNCDKASNLPRKVSEPVVDINNTDTGYSDEEIVFDDCEEEEDAFSGWGRDDECEEDEYDPWANMGDSSNDSYEEEGENCTIPEEVDIDEAINSIREIPAHTQTRQYLFEEYSKVLPLANSDFSKLKQISENSDNFIIFDEILRNASIQVGTHEDKIPELLELRENQFIIQIVATRPSGLKEEDIANEISNIYSRDEFGGIVHEGVYATTSSVGSKYIINIFKGENSLITLGDTYKEVSDFILNPNVKKPIVLGVNELGKVWKFDAENVFSYIFSGKPRTGKSWSVISLVTQLAMYSPPSEVTFEAFDVKDTSSDFYSLKGYLPHFKRFEGNPQNILKRLRYLTTTEANRRAKILEENNVLNIADLKKKGADVELPYVYVIIDEIVGLKNKISKDENNEFKDLVNTLVTQMPNLGFRVILVPHRVTNEVISKTTYTLIGCVACVKSDFKEINTTLEVSRKDFPYSLPNLGDMALKTSEINKGNAVFCHGSALTSDNDKNKDIYRFVGTLWNTLEPSKEDTNITEVKKEQYKGHELEGVNSMEDFLEEEEWEFNDESHESDTLQGFWDKFK